MKVLRSGLLAGQRIAVAGPLRAPVLESLRSLGATVEPLPDGLDDQGLEQWTTATAPLHAIVYDAAASIGAGGRDGLLATLELGWPAIRAVAAGALIPAGAGGRIVVIAPAADATIPHIEPARAALENIARTLSIEWARYSITSTVIAPAASTDVDQLATLVGFLLSPAGGYYSGCRFELA